MEEVAPRVLKEETGLIPLRMEKKGVMDHIWPHYPNITVLYRVYVVDDDVDMNEEHRAFKWVDRPLGDLPPPSRR